MVSNLLSIRFFFLCVFVRAFLPSPSFTGRLVRSRQRQQIAPMSEGDESSRWTMKTFLQVSTVPSPSETSEESAEEDCSNEEFDMPWSEFQDWALLDNLPRYVITIPSRKDLRQQTTFALWRTMMREVPELGGYPIDMLQTMHARQMMRQDYKNATRSSTTPGVLPLLDEFEFDASGGVSGRVYGVPGIADGSNIVTKEVADMHFTVPKGYVVTQEGAVAYELGTPLRQSYSLDVAGNKGREDLAAVAADVTAQLGKGAVSKLPATQGDPDAMLVRLGVTTAIVLGGATAINMLSHHLTVNVFWV